MSEAKQRTLNLTMSASAQSLPLDGRVLTPEMTAEALNTFRGPQGPKGNDGFVKFEELTDEQREMLRGPRGFDGPAGPVGPEGPQGPQGIPGKDAPQDAFTPSNPPTPEQVGALPSGGTAVNANALNGKSADQYALKTDLPKAGDWDGNTVPKDIPDGISYVEAGNLTDAHGFPVRYCTVLSVKHNVTRLFQILVEKESGRMQIRSAKDGTTWAEWQPYLRATDTAADSYKLDGKDSVYYHKKLSHPRNLLDNSDFRNPVNQRGQTSYSMSSAYCIDRWMMWQIVADGTYGTFTVNSGYISLSENLKCEQRILSECVKPNAIYTAAAKKTDGEIILVSGRFETGATNDEGIYIKTSSISSFGVVGIMPGDYLWVVLYEGEYTADNLPPYVPKGYAVELVECMRYYRPEREYILQCYASGYLYGHKFELPMRDGVNPTPIIGKVYNDVWNEVSGDTSIMDTYKFGFGYVANSNFVAGKCYRVNAAFTSDM